MLPYYITIYKDNDGEIQKILCLAFRALHQTQAEERMNAMIKIWCEDDITMYNINLYEMKWINGV